MASTSWATTTYRGAAGETQGVGERQSLSPVRAGQEEGDGIEEEKETENRDMEVDVSQAKEEIDKWVYEIEVAMQEQDIPKEQRNTAPRCWQS